MAQIGAVMADEFKNIGQPGPKIGWSLDQPVFGQAPPAFLPVFVLGGFGLVYFLRATRRGPDWAPAQLEKWRFGRLEVELKV